jgi:hypothetical protein
MQVLYPIFLFGLVGLAVPILIHLWSRNTRKSVGFGTLKFLKTTETKTMRSLLPSELWLLLLRLGLLSSFILIMSAPYFQSTSRLLERITVVDPTYRQAKWLPAVLDTADQVVWLNTHFPSIEDSSSLLKIDDYWEVLCDLDQLQAKEIIVFSPLPIADFGPDRKEIRNISQWYAPGIHENVRVSKHFTKQDQSWELALNSDNSRSFFERKTSDIQGDTLIITFRIAVGEQYKSQEKVIRAALGAIQQVNRIFSLSEQANADWLIWLSDSTPPVRRKLIFLDTDQASQFEKRGPDIYALNPSMIKPKHVVDSHLVLKLEETFASSFNVSFPDPRIMPIAQLAAHEQMPDEKILVKESVTDYLWTILVLLFILERYFSNRQT